MEDRLTDRPSSGPLFTRLLVFGNTATAIKNPESDHTHRWTVYVRGFNGEDISPYVRKVAFRLHESFLQPTRGTRQRASRIHPYSTCVRGTVVDKAPFEVSETGWGEFQIQIRVFFHEAPEKPVVLQHNLRLYMAGEDLDAQLKNSGKPVIAEHIDEVVRLGVSSSPPIQLTFLC